MLVVVESPYRGKVPENTRYLQACLRCCLEYGAAPFASHQMYTQCMDDDDPAERAAGIAAGHAWRVMADETWVFTDLGISQGMEDGIRYAEELGQPVRYVSLLSVGQMYA